MIDKSVGTSGLMHDGHFVGWDPSFIRKLLISLVRKKIGLFATYPEYGVEDLLQVAEKAMCEAWPKWNPSRAAMSTYLYKAGSNAIISAWREAEKNHRSEKGHQRAEDASEVFADTAAIADGGLLEGLAAVLAKVEMDPKESVRDWLKRLYDTACQHKDPAWKRECSFAQAVAITCLMKRMKTGCGGVRQLLEQEDAFRAAIGLGKQVPTRRTIHRLAGDVLSAS